MIVMILSTQTIDGITIDVWLYSGHYEVVDITAINKASAYDTFIDKQVRVKDVKVFC